jgi:hypothetical protein
MCKSLATEVPLTLMLSTFSVLLVMFLSIQICYVVLVRLGFTVHMFVLIPCTCVGLRCLI